MNLQIINDCAGTDPGLPTAGTDPGRRYQIMSKKSINTFTGNCIKTVDANSQDSVLRTKLIQIILISYLIILTTHLFNYLIYTS